MWWRYIQPMVLTLSVMVSPVKSAVRIGTQTGKGIDDETLLRRLQDDEERPCNSFLTTVSAEEIESIAENLLGYLVTEEALTAEQGAAARGVYVDPINYDVIVSKFCGKCSDFAKTPYAHTDNWNSYCGPDAYAYDATFSGLVYLPMDDTTGGPIAADLNGFMSFQGTRFDLTGAPSVAFPLSVSEVLATDDFVSVYLAFSDAYLTMLAASAGAIGIEFDYLGTGESSDFPRSYLTQNPVETGSVVSWLAAQRYVKKATQGCTMLRNEAITSGWSLGGTTVVWGTAALQTIGVEIKRAFSKSAPYDPTLGTWLAFLLVAQTAQAGGTLSASAVFFGTFLFASFSNEMPFLSNTGTGQKILGPAWRDEADLDNNLLYLYFVEKPLRDDLLAQVPTNAGLLLTSLFDPSYASEAFTALQAVANGDSLLENVPCQPDYINAGITAICQAYEENNAYNVLAEADYPVEWCHSESDTTVVYLFSAALSGLGNDNIVQYEPPLDFLTPTVTSHRESSIFCLSAETSFFAMDDGSFFFNNAVTESSSGKKGGNSKNCPACLDSSDSSSFSTKMKGKKGAESDGPGLCAVHL